MFLALTLVVNDPSICKIVTTMTPQFQNCNNGALFGDGSKILQLHFSEDLARSDDILSWWSLPQLSATTVIAVSESFLTWLSISSGQVCIYIQIVLKQLLLVQRRHILIKFEIFLDSVFLWQLFIHVFHDSCLCLCVQSPWETVDLICETSVLHPVVPDDLLGWWQPLQAGAAAVPGHKLFYSRPCLGTTRHKQLD